MITALAKHHWQVILFGEILGSDVHMAMRATSGYRAFDLMIDGRYVDFPTFRWLCGEYTVLTVPVFGAGFTFGMQCIRDLAKGSTVVSANGHVADHIREGVVVKPIIERTDPRNGRVVLKFVSDDFLLAKHRDFTEVYAYGVNSSLRVTFPARA